jgi:hypothetical protein
LASLHEYLNAILIAAHQVVRDTGATLIFIMDSVDVVNKCLSTKALTINMPDERKVTSTHVCNKAIPGLPHTLTGHIVLHLAIASLIGIHPLCNVGRTMVFDMNKCNVIYDVNVLLWGCKDSSTNLWTLPLMVVTCGPPFHNLPQFLTMPRMTIQKCTPA